jgi:hypothetical protein
VKRGLYRIHGINDLPDDVRMDDDGIEVPVEERLYRARGYLPLVEDLPWRDEYLNSKRSPASASATQEGDAKASREQSRQDFLKRFSKP